MRELNGICVVKGKVKKMMKLFYFMKSIYQITNSIKVAFPFAVAERMQGHVVFQKLLPKPAIVELLEGWTEQTAVPHGQ